MLVPNENKHLARARMMKRYQRDQQDVLAYVLWEAPYYPSLTWRFADLARINYQLIEDAYLEHVFG